MRHSLKTTIIRCTALAGGVGAALASVSPATAGQPGPRVALARNGQAAPMPALDIITEARHHELAAAAASFAGTALTYPYGVTVDINSNVCITNLFGGVNVYNSYWKQTGGITDSTLASPSSTYIDADDTVWVLDAAGTLHPSSMTTRRSPRRIPTAPPWGLGGRT